MKIKAEMLFGKWAIYFLFFCVFFISICLTQNYEISIRNGATLGIWLSCFMILITFLYQFSTFSFMWGKYTRNFKRDVFFLKKEDEVKFCNMRRLFYFKTQVCYVLGWILVICICSEFVYLRKWATSKFENTDAIITAGIFLCVHLSIIYLGKWMPNFMAPNYKALDEFYKRIVFEWYEVSSRLRSQMHITDIGETIRDMFIVARSGPYSETARCKHCGSFVSQLTLIDGSNMESVQLDIHHRKMLKHLESKCSKQHEDIVSVVV